MNGWTIFAHDWDPDLFDLAGLERSHRGGGQSHTLSQLLEAREEASTLFKRRGLPFPWIEFNAHVKSPTLSTCSLSLDTQDTANGFTYQYLFDGHIPVLRGGMTGLWAPSAGGTGPVERRTLDQPLVLYKLDQFKALFPSVTHLWIFLDALLSAHFLHGLQACGSHGKTRKAPELLCHKAQFCTAAVDRAFWELDGDFDLQYFVQKLCVGKYTAYTLTASSHGVPLMRLELGLGQKVARPREVDIVLQ